VEYARFITGEREKVAADCESCRSQWAELVIYPKSLKKILRANNMPEHEIEKLDGDIDGDFFRIMDFFCNRWTGKTIGTLSGCKISLMPENFEAVSVYNDLGSCMAMNNGQASIHNTDIESAIRMRGIEDIKGCFIKVKILADEIISSIRKRSIRNGENA